MAVLGKICLKSLEAIFFLDLTFSCTNGLTRHQKSVKDQKKATKVKKAFVKAAGLKYENLIIFSCFWNHLVSSN